MRYMFLIYEDEKRERSLEILEEYGKFTQLVNDRKVFRAGDPLQPTSTSTTVRVRDREATSTDGPFAKTREQLGGYYVLDCTDLDEALSYAAQIPSARFGAIEVRPIRAM